MKTSALQEFLRSLGIPLAAVGVQRQSLEDINSLASAFEAFKDLDLAQLSDFLGRALSYREGGEVPVATVPGFDEMTMTTHRLSDWVRSVRSAELSQVAELEGKITQAQEQLKSDITEIAKSFGLTVTIKSKEGWVSSLSEQTRTRAAAEKAIEKFQQLKERITSSESYQLESVASGIDSLATTDPKILKAAAVSLNVSAQGTGKKFVQALLVKLTKISDKPPKPKADRKAAKPAASTELVEEMIKQIKETIDRAKDPTAVTLSEIEQLLTRVSSEFSDTQQKAIATKVTGEVTGKGKAAAEDAIKRLRTALTAVKVLVDHTTV